MHWSEQTPSSNNTREDSTPGHHQMVNTEIRLIIFFAAKDGEALSQTRQRQHPGVLARTVVVERLRLAAFGSQLLCGCVVKWRMRAAQQRRFVQSDFAQNRTHGIE